jgi:hypothetical protein
MGLRCEISEIQGSALHRHITQVLLAIGVSYMDGSLVAAKSKDESKWAALGHVL